MKSVFRDLLTIVTVISIVANTRKMLWSYFLDPQIVKVAKFMPSKLTFTSLKFNWLNLLLYIRAKEENVLKVWKILGKFLVYYSTFLKLFPPPSSSNFNLAMSLLTIGGSCVFLDGMKFYDKIYVNTLCNRRYSLLHTPP